MIAESSSLFQHSAKRLSFDEREQARAAADSYQGVEPLFDENSPPKAASPVSLQAPGRPNKAKKLF